MEEGLGVRIPSFHYTEFKSLLLHDQLFSMMGCLLIHPGLCLRGTAAPSVLLMLKMDMKHHQRGQVDRSLCFTVQGHQIRRLGEVD